MKISITFDPASDSLDNVVGAVEALYSGETANIEAYQDAEGTQPVTAADLPTVDSTGLPWDARIHVSPAKLTSSGKWTSRRKLDAALVASVEAELRGKAEPSTPAAMQLPAPPAPVAPAAPPAPAPLPAPAAPTAYEKLVKLIGDNMHSTANPAGRISDAWVKATLEAYGVAGGLLQNCATMATDDVENIIAGITGALAG